MGTPVSHRPGLAMVIPACILAFLAIVGGFDKSPFEAFVGTALPHFPETAGAMSEAMSSAAAGLAFLVGVLAAWYAYLRNPALSRAAAANPAGRLLHRFWFADWGMDWLYDHLFVRPVVWFATANKADVVDSIYRGLARLATLCYHALSLTETGKLRWYAAWIAGGTAVLLAIVIFV
jgi:NADH-quinone oxidoreductase subunit L